MPRARLVRKYAGELGLGDRAGSPGRAGQRVSARSAVAFNTAALAEIARKLKINRPPLSYALRDFFLRVRTKDCRGRSGVPKKIAPSWRTFALVQKRANLRGQGRYQGRSPRYLSSLWCGSALLQKLHALRPNVHNQCREPEAAFISRPIRGQLLHALSMRDSEGWKKTARRKKRKKLAALFKNLK